VHDSKWAGHPGRERTLALLFKLGKLFPVQRGKKGMNLKPRELMLSISDLRSHLMNHLKLAYFHLMKLVKSLFLLLRNLPSHF